ncbi:hypothetical protein L249_5872 [Ophiocordyceps polyrhachis-furcata BCC 54312]|uniref:Uncharacterized protein n=1 Tax=Ophiocordyceps polyrhachis-furcata BCC 54312 TaxID=1330021 RepID=A0A367L0C2_9HYPO|nr:hypothetical protein L249_5872 [Ophiocordyceps polyrhachis-furcata BCC 54312]
MQNVEAPAVVPSEYLKTSGSDIPSVWSLRRRRYLAQDGGGDNLGVTQKLVSSSFSSALHLCLCLEFG